MRLAIAVVIVVAGCSTPPSARTSFKEIQRDVSRRIGADVRWQEMDAAIDAAVKKLLAKDLTAEGAVQVALLMNRNLQATIEDLGIARADLVQAGLLKNPVLDLSVRIPDRRPSKAYLDFSVAESFLDVLWLPAKKKIAAAQFQATKARVTNEVLSLAAETKIAFYAYQGAMQLAELRRTAADAMIASAQAAADLHKAGNLSDLDLLTQKTQAARARIEVEDAKAEVVAAREKLTALMGLRGEENWKAAGHLPELPKDEVDLRKLEAASIRQRADLAAARNDVLAQSESKDLAERTRFLAQVDAGPEFERETDGQWRIGPTINVLIPFFDQGQAVIARARGVLRQSEERYAALVVQIRSEVRAEAARMKAAREKAAYYHDELMPLEEQLVAETQKHFNGMYVGIFQLLQAKRDQVDAARQYIESLKEYWIARSELERSLGGRLTSGGSR